MPVPYNDRLERAYRENILPAHEALMNGHDPDGELEGGRPPA